MGADFPQICISKRCAGLWVHEKSLAVIGVGDRVYLAQDYICVTTEWHTSHE